MYICLWAHKKTGQDFGRFQGAYRLGDMHNMVVPCFRMEFGEKLSEAGDGMNKFVLYRAYLTASWSVLSMGGQFVFHSLIQWRM